jgi:hypothetical protein
VVALALIVVVAKEVFHLAPQRLAHWWAVIVHAALVTLVVVAADLSLGTAAAGAVVVAGDNTHTQ